MTDQRTDEELAAVATLLTSYIHADTDCPFYARSHIPDFYDDMADDVEAALTELTRRLTERTEEVARLRKELDYEHSQTVSLTLQLAAKPMPYVQTYTTSTTTTTKEES